MAKVGREYQHLEDLVYCEPDGMHRALYTLRNISNRTVSVKWDGMPTIYWGRNSSGKFTLVGKNGWGREWISSPEELENWIISRGRGERWRPQFAKSVANMWNILEPATPMDFNGFVFADVLWHPGNSFASNDKSVWFTPNQVSYYADVNSVTGQRVMNSKLGLAVHLKHRDFGDSDGRGILTVPNINSADVFIIPQTVPASTVQVPNDKIKYLEKLIDKNSTKVLQLMERRAGLSDFPDIVYRYVNFMSKSDNIKRIGDIDEFKNFINQSNITFNKQNNIMALISRLSDNFVSMFDIINAFIEIKNDLIAEYDSVDAPFTQSTYGTPGGEGYVLLTDRIKLVNRERWKPNSALF